MRLETPCLTLTTLLLLVGCGGSSGGSSGSTTTPVASGSTSASVSSSSTAPAISQVPIVPTVGVFDPARTITVLANGFDPNGTHAAGAYGVDHVSGIVRRLAGRLNLPTGDTTPTATDQVTEVAYYGATPPAYYSAQDLQEVNGAPRGTARYARIVAKFVRHVLDRSGADHVNLVGASYGGLITRYLIEKDLEGLASSGRIVRWLNVESAAGGVWVAQQAARFPLLTQLLQALLPNFAFDLSDVPSMTYDFVEQAFSTPDPRRSRSPFFAHMIVGFTISSDYDLSQTQQMLRTVSGLPDDGVLLSRDQVLHLDAKPAPGPAVLVTDTTHYSAISDEGLAVDIANFLRSRRRVRVRLVSAEARSLPELATQGPGEVVFCTRVASPAAQQEWGVTDALSVIDDALGTAVMTPFATGDVKSLGTVLFDWFVAPSEQALELTLSARELDYAPWYGLFETGPAHQLMDEAKVSLPVTTPGTTTYVVDTPSFRAELEVQVLDE